ncbi:hypothetical protein ABZS29_21105 [Kribbella sp. NPDC005582]|uniref:hypothetical protein n=1 Tax=Kribbella sp. NPDC005582 TaxID=3156893 RepID=UPI0033AB12DF
MSSLGRRRGPSRNHEWRTGTWAKVGPDLSLPFRDLRLGATYVGEVVAFLAFGIAWLASSKDLEPGTFSQRVGRMVKSAAGTLGIPQKT